MMEMDYSTLSYELDNIFFECPTDKSGCAKVKCLIDAFVNKYGKENPELRNIISNRLDPEGCNSSISRSHFKQLILDWIISKNLDDTSTHPVERYNNLVTRDKLEVFEYGATSCVHSTPLGRFNQRYRKVPQKKLSYSPSQEFAADSLENFVFGLSQHEELRSFKTASKTHNSSLENSLVKAEQKIIALEDELKQVKLLSKREFEKFKEDLHRLQIFEKLHAEAMNKNEKYVETLNNLTLEYYKLKRSKDNLDKDYSYLETEFQRLQSELNAKNVSLKTLETYKRVQTEELVVLQESREILESENIKLKTDVESRSENEKSLLDRIGELQFEKQNLQAELNEYMHFEKLKMVSSSPFGNSTPFDDVLTENSEDNRESGISVRSELMDSFGFTSCLNETLPQCYYSVISSDEVSFGYHPTQFNFVVNRGERIEKEVQTEGIKDKRKYQMEQGIQTEKIKKAKVETNQQEVQTEQTVFGRVEKYQQGTQTDKIQDKRPIQFEKGIQTEMHTKKSFVEKSSQAYFPDLMNKNSDLENISICSSDIAADQQFDSRCFYSRMDIDSSLEEMHMSFGPFSHGRTVVEGHDGGREANYPLANDSYDASTSLDKSAISYDMLPMFGKHNMSTPILRIRKLETRRFSCLDVYNRPLTFHKPSNYQKLTFSKKMATIFAGIVSIISPGIRTCMKTLLILLTIGLLLFGFIGMLILTRRKDLTTIQQFFRPYFELKYPKGSPPI